MVIFITLMHHSIYIKQIIKMTEKCLELNEFFFLFMQHTYTQVHMFFERKITLFRSHHLFILLLESFQHKHQTTSIYTNSSNI